MRPSDYLPLKLVRIPPTRGAGSTRRSPQAECERPGMIGQRRAAKLDASQRLCWPGRTGVSPIRTLLVSEQHQHTEGSRWSVRCRSSFASRDGPRGRRLARADGERRPGRGRRDQGPAAASERLRPAPAAGQDRARVCPVGALAPLEPVRRGLGLTVGTAPAGLPPRSKSSAGDGPAAHTRGPPPRHALPTGDGITPPIPPRGIGCVIRSWR